MDAHLANLAIICIGIIATLTILGATVVSSIVAWRHPQQATAALMGIIEGEKSIRLFSTFGVVTAAALLALSGALSEGAIALLSSVAGFMLGGIGRKAPEDDTKGVA